MLCLASVTFSYDFVDQQEYLPNGIPVSFDKVHRNSPIESLSATVKPKRT